MSGGIEAGSNAITTNESLPIVSLSTTTNDKKCFGVISASEDPKERSDAFGNFVSVTEKEKGDTRVYINSVGEGAIWVSNIGGTWRLVITSRHPTWLGTAKNKTASSSRTTRSLRLPWIAISTPRLNQSNRFFDPMSFRPII
jgi:hypothetical protein